MFKDKQIASEISTLMPPSCVEKKLLSTAANSDCARGSRCHTPTTILTLGYATSPSFKSDGLLADCRRHLRYAELL